MKSIILIGFMGAGKTTIGRQLSIKLSLPVFDLDDEIIKKEGRSIKEVFDQHGEEYFRKVETAVLKEQPKENAIITTGGGIILREQNRCWLKDHGIVIFLDCKPEEIYKRIEHDSSRPLLIKNKKESIYNLYQSRYLLYKETANVTIDTTSLTVKEVIGEIENLLL